MLTFHHSPLKAVNDLVTAVNVLTGKVKELDKKLDKPKQITVCADTRPIQEIMKKGVADMWRPLLRGYHLLSKESTILSNIKMGVLTGRFRKKVL